MTEEPYYNQPTTNIQLTLELQQFKAENSRLQQLIKIANNKINDLQEQLKSSNDKVSELKSVQELNRELVEALSEWVEVAKRKYPPKDPTGIALLKHYESIIKKSAPFKSAQK